MSHRPPKTATTLLRRGLHRRRFITGAGALLTAPLIGATGCASSTISTSSARAAATEPDLIFLGGEIHTVNPTDDRVSALAIGNGRVIAAGSDQQIAQLAGAKTRRINLDGRTLLPGINDSHLHLTGWSLEQPPFAIDVSSPNVRSIADCVEEVRLAVARAKPGEWILGRGWDQPYFAEGRAPTAADLDPVSPNNPVALTEFSGHAVWANTKALEAAGITSATQPPAGGVIVKDDAGNPTGLLFEGAAWSLDKVIPENSPERIKTALRSAMESLLARGITSATDPWLSAEQLGTYAELALEANPHRMRMSGLISAGTNRMQLADALEELNALRALDTIDPRFMRFAGVKVMGDGIPTGNKTAWLNEPYVGGGNGKLLLDGDTHEARVNELQTMIRMADAAGVQIGTHVTGDRSIDEAITALEIARLASNNTDARHYLIHADLVTPTALKEMQRLGVGANFNPEIKHLIADSQVDSIGPERAAYEWPYRTALNTGVRVASSSDAPVTPGNWLQGLATCVNRLGKQSGKISGPDQRITLDEAIRSYTLTAAWQDHAEAYKGSLEPGKVADCCVLDERLSAIDSEAYKDAKISMTLVDGKIVYDASVTAHPS